MDDATIRRLVDLNNSFYAQNHESFSSTRLSPWPGWERVCSSMEVDRDGYAVLDVACGNMRFERYVSGLFPGVSVEFDCVDSCPALAQPTGTSSFFEADVMECLLAGEGIPAKKGFYDAAVSFGFMHHVPTQALRSNLLRALMESLATGGLAAVSFWRFMDDEALARRAVEMTRQAHLDIESDLEVGDYLLGWNKREGVYRYCHSFTSSEIDELIGSVSDMGTCIDRFESDGRTGTLNGYAVIRRR